MFSQIDICQNEKDGDIRAKQKELELAELEDFGNGRISKVGICVAVR